MSETRKTASFLIRAWQEPSQWQPPGKWRVSARPLKGGKEVLFKSATELWRYLTDEEAHTHFTLRSKSLKIKRRKKE